MHIYINLYIYIYTCSCCEVLGPDVAQQRVRSLVTFGYSVVNRALELFADVFALRLGTPHQPPPEDSPVAILDQTRQPVLCSGRVWTLEVALVLITWVTWATGICEILKTCDVAWGLFSKHSVDLGSNSAPPLACPKKKHCQVAFSHTSTRNFQQARAFEPARVSCSTFAFW